jgi:hypothetical protein
MPEIRESTILQIIVNDQRNWVEVSRYDYLYTIHLLGQNLMGECAHGEGLSIEEAIYNFTKSWQAWSEHGPY